MKKHQDIEKEHSNDSKAFIQCSNRMGDVYNNIDDQNS